MDGQPTVRSVWWRSGYDRWNPYSDNDEVGEGWLVLGSAALADALRQRGRLLRIATTWTGRHGDGDTSADEKRHEVVAEI
jgi:hypothetical protein